MNCSAIILTGGQSNRFGRNKSLVNLFGKPIISYVVDSVIPLVDEVLLITDTADNQRDLLKIFAPPIKILLDEFDIKSPVVGALTGFKHTKAQRSLLLPCDTPLISKKVISLLLELTKDYDLVIPKWPTGYIEPLQAAYDTKKAYTASLEAIAQNELRMFDIVKRLKNVLYVSTIVLSKLDPKLNTFLNVNTNHDLARVQRTLRLTNKSRL